MKTLPNFFKKKPVLSKIKKEEPIFKEQVLATKKTEIKEVKTIVPANKMKRQSSMPALHIGPADKVARIYIQTAMATMITGNSVA